MKKIYTILAFAAALATASCTTDLSGVESRLDALEKDMTAVKGQLASLNDQLAALEKFKNGQVINSASCTDDEWTIRLSDGTTIKVTASTADQTGNAPILSVDSDGYWMADYGDGEGYVYVYDNAGSKIKAAGKDGSNGTDGTDGKDGVNGVTPVLGVNADGYWTVNGTVLNDANGKPVKAVVAEGDSYFDAVESKDGNLVFTLKNGEVISVPVAPEFIFAIKGAEEPVEFTLGETIVFDVEAKGIASAMVTKPEGWTVELTETALTVTAPSAMTKAMVVYNRESTISVLAVSDKGYVVLTGVEVSLSDGVNKKSNFEMYQADYNLTIDDKPVTKALYGPATHITSDTSISAPGVYFVDNGVTLTWTAGSDINGNVIIMSDAVKNSNAKLVFTQALSLMSGNLYIKSMDVSATGANSNHEIINLYNKDGASVGDVVIDDCFLHDMIVIASKAASTQVNTKSITVVNSTINVPSVIRLIGYHTSAYIDDVKVENNLFYAKEMNSSYYVITGVNVRNSIQVNRNTFINIQAPGNPIVSLSGTTAIPCSVKWNLVYIDYLSMRSGFVGQVDCTNVVDNKVWVKDIADPSYQFLVGWLKWEWVPRFTECPFTKMDFDTPEFVKTDEASAYGCGSTASAGKDEPVVVVESETKTQSVAAGAKMALKENFIRKNTVLAVEVSASSFQPFTIGRGSEGVYQAWWAEVTAGEVVSFYYDGSKTVEKERKNHGLTLAGDVKVKISEGVSSAATMLIESNGAKASVSLSGWWGGGAPFFQNDGSAAVNATLSFTPQDASADVWIFGDSYIAWTYDQRWPYFLVQKGYTKWFADHLPGGASARLFDCFRNDLQFGAPKYAVWTLGMNDAADTDVVNSTYTQYADRFIALCEENGIIPVLGVVPSVPTRKHTFKAEWARSRGVAVIDFAAAVNKPDSQEWQDGFLYTDGVHPAAPGAEALANRFLADFPEPNLLK